MVQYIVYTVSDVEHCIRLHADGVISQRKPHLLLVLGSYAERRAGRPRDLLPMLSALPSGWARSLCSFGAEELGCVAAGALFDGHVRVGFENNPQLVSGEVAADNAALVAQAVIALTRLGLRPATCAEARSFFR